MPAITVSDCKISRVSPLYPLMPVLKEWANLIADYSNILELGDSDDACYWYNERANVGLWAAAAWRTPGRWVALQEYSEDKRGEDGKDKNGRCDLYLGKLCADRDILDFAIEAKLAWQDMSSTLDEPSIGATKQKMTEAWIAAGELKSDAAANRVAACFVVPKFSVEKQVKSQTTFEKLIIDWVESIYSELKPDAIAWVFPKESRERYVKRTKKFYPGVCLLLQIRKRGNKAHLKTKR